MAKYDTINAANMTKGDNFHKYQINATQLKQPPSLQRPVQANYVPPPIFRLELEWEKYPKYNIFLRK
jgi:hypothetical protein